MACQIYTATGCPRCKITGRFMKENDIGCEEHDIKAGGREVFAEFYRTNRSHVYRGADGVEFPVFTDGEVIRQGVGAVLEVLAYLKQNNLKIQVTTDGRNAAVLKSVFDKKLADRVVATVRGPAHLYAALTATAIDERELVDTIALAARFPDYRFYTTIAPLERENGRIEYLTPEEIGETARQIEAATGSKKHPYTLRIFRPQQPADDRFKSIEPLPDSAVFKYRTAARRYMVMTEIVKQRTG